MIHSRCRISASFNGGVIWIHVMTCQLQTAWAVHSRQVLHESLPGHLGSDACCRTDRDPRQGIARSRSFTKLPRDGSM
ncbi:hypothetical protein EJ03DRAFT_5658 [Teratosphaeria nubilosa]|uniref:Uncharacterized protein n=1 Tax=Teratosphaeria nubilosa TaxID=161662 RepID=A0A6G1LP07_9PEZI|nr:hypothetical protein EJ03DRAFT_5658 [Teratosphaeria nubilosa]